MLSKRMTGDHEGRDDPAHEEDVVSCSTSGLFSDRSAAVSGTFPPHACRRCCRSRAAVDRGAERF